LPGLSTFSDEVPNDDQRGDGIEPPSAEEKLSDKR
jgi:hypothetical protein